MFRKGRRMKKTGHRRRRREAPEIRRCRRYWLLSGVSQGRRGRRQRCCRCGGLKMISADASAWNVNVGVRVRARARASACANENERVIASVSESRDRSQTRNRRMVMWKEWSCRLRRRGVVAPGPEGVKT